MLIIVSIDESLPTVSVASSNCATGACCLMLENVPAWCFDVKSSSTCWMRGVLLARDEPVTMKAFEDEEGRQERRCFWTELGP